MPGIIKTEAKAEGGDHTAPSTDELLGRARALVPILKDRAAEDAANRCVRRETIEEMGDARLHLALVPKRWGGFELSPRVGLEISRILAMGDLSVSWLHGIYCNHAYHLAYFPDGAQEEVWADGPGARIVSPYAPEGTATPVPGGYKLRGRWRYSSGCIYSDWAMIGGLILREGLPPEYRVFLIPRSDYQVLDTWHVTGLEATASNDLLVEEVFVPEHRTLQNHPVEDFDVAARAGNPGHIYRIPFYQIAYRSLSTGQLGVLEAMIDAFVDLNKSRINMSGGEVKGDPDAQFAVAAAKSGLDEMLAVLDRNVAKLEADARARRDTSLEERLRFRFQSSHVAQRVFELATLLYQSAGTRSIIRAMPFELPYRNILAARAHFANTYTDAARKFGSFELGLPHSERDASL